MHVLIIPSEHFQTDWSPLGGVFQLDLARGLRDSGAKVGVLSVGKFPGLGLFRRWNYPAKEVFECIPVFRRYFEFWLPQRVDAFMLLGSVYALRAEALFKGYVGEYGEPEIIHAHNVRYAGQIAASLLKRYGVPYVVTEHSSEYQAGAVSGNAVDIFRRIVLGASGVSAVSGSFAGIIERTLGLPADSVEVIPNILPAPFQREPLKFRCRGGGSTFVFLNVAELVPVKDQQSLLRGFAFRFRGKNACLRIVGDGPCRDSLGHLSRELGVQDQVTFCGRLTREAVLTEMSMADCFVLSSKTETFGVVLIEALAQGLPVVATACGGPQDIVSGGNGLLVPPENPQSLGDAMYNMYISCKDYVGGEIASSARERYGATTVVAQYSGFYERALRRACRDD